MAQIDFPNSPINNQTVVVNGVTYTYDSAKNRWNRTVSIGGGGGGGASVTVGTTAPASPSNGDLWFDSTDLLLYMYYADGSSNQWVQVIPSGTSISAGTNPPTNADSGDLWFDPADLILYVNYNDGSSTQWVKVVPGGGSSSANTLSLSDFSVTQNPASSTGTLSYNNTTGVFTYTPPDLTSFLTSVTYSQVANTPTNLSQFVNDSGFITGYTVTANDVIQYEANLTIDYTQLTNTPTDVDDYIRAYRYQGALTINTGTKRFYLHDSYTLSSIYAYVDTAPVGAAINLTARKNGVALQNFSIADGNNAGATTSLSHSFVAGDYVTVDITQIGSTTAGDNLYVVFVFR